MTLENYKVRNIAKLPAGGFTGRRKILTPVKEITAENVREVVEKALAVHSKNAAEITYLYNVYLGCMDIRSKQKYVRENINNKVTVNIPHETVTFKSAFLLQDPVQYVSHGGNDDTSRLVDGLNEMMRQAGREAHDAAVADWFHICGVAPRMALVATEEDDTAAPFCDYALDPRRAFAIYHDGIGEKRLAGVVIGVDENGETGADVYTRDKHFLIKGDAVTELSSPQYGRVPLVEYADDCGRLGSFETGLSILNNINTLESNAVDSIEDFVNGFDVFQNCEIADGAYGELSIGGKAVMIKTSVQGAEAKVYRVASELNQGGVQERIDDLKGQYLEIVGMPSINGGASTSDTGTAVLLREGWQIAGSRRRRTITTFKKAERELDEVILNICRVQGVEVPNIEDFEPHYPEGSLMNLQSITQSFIELLNNPKVHPKYAYKVGSALFDDSEEAYRAGMEYYETSKAEQTAALDRLTSRDSEDDGDGEGA